MQSIAIKTYYLGDLSRIDNPQYTFRWGTCTGSDVYVGDFTDATEGITFGTEYSHVKHVIQNINEAYKKANSQMTTNNYRANLKYHWLPLVTNLEHKWGKELIPGDVRHAKNNVETNLGIALTTWPTQHKIF